MISRSKRAKYLGGVMTAICELMRSYGISKQRAQQEFRAALDRGYAIGRLSPSRELRPITRLADVCTRWHLEKAFTDREGKPKPLTWDGKNGSLLKLAKVVSGPKTAREVVLELISRRLIKKSSGNKWLPKAKIVSPSGLDHAQTLRTATMFDRLIRTIAYNTQLKYRGPVLFEVMAQVPRLPARDVADFRRFTKAHGLIFAKTIDDWLETRNILRSRKKRIPTREAGIVAFAFHEPSRD
jgi:hypothetical protein